jgi:GNAT superfamily N-acetyltransferase
LAESPEDIAAVKAVFLDYLRFVEDFLGESLGFQGTDVEFATFPAIYDDLWLAEVGGEVVGAVGLKPFRGDIAEVKRLYVRPEGRGHAFGHKLMIALIEGAKARGYATLYLDTDRGLHHANSIYESLKFRDIGVYYDSPRAERSRYMALDLTN